MDRGGGGQYGFFVGGRRIQYPASGKGGAVVPGGGTFWDIKPATQCH